MDPFLCGLAAICALLSEQCTDKSRHCQDKFEQCSNRRNDMTKTPSRKASKKEDYHHGDLRNVLIQTAKKILIEDGLDRMTLRHCTKVAGVSPSALSHHFKNLEGLLSSVAASGFEDLAEAIKSNLKELKDKEDPVKNVLRTYINFAIENSDLYRAMFSPKTGLGAGDYIEANQECFLILRDQVAKQKRKLGGLSAEITAFRIWALAHGFLLMAMTENAQIVLPDARIENENLDEVFFQYLMKGLW